MKPIYWSIVGLSLLVGITAIIEYSKFKANWNMCKTYYSEMSTWDCYWSPKVLPQRSSR